ncbi:unnamed protein product [Ilex paraguariensis]|uniref:DNA ligase n=1 Tax=Ilex paraguariensis TaxID=185542 RepID=A0ABC8V1M4_9AQUA
MLSLRSCCYSLTHSTLSHHLKIYLNLSPSLCAVSLSSPKPFSFKLILSPNHTPKSTMSSRPSAFDVLMSNASKKKAQSQTQQSSPKKRKTLESNTTNQNPRKTQTPNSETQLLNEPKLDGKEPNCSNSKPIEETRVANGSKDDQQTPKLDVKKRRLISAHDSIVELKKKAANFSPQKAAFWGEGDKVPFLFLVKVFDAISKESGRIAITEMVCNMLRTVIQMTPEDLVAVVYLSANRIAPAHEGLELGIGDASIIKALAEACGTKDTQIKKQYKELGDLGLVAKASRSSQPLMRKPEVLTIAKVFDTFRLIAKRIEESGKDSQEKKKNHIKALLVAATDCEPQYLIRLLQTKLRIGLAEQTLLAALGHAAVYTEKHSSSPPDINSPLEEAAKIVKQVYSVIPVYDKIVSALLTGGVWNLAKTCSFSPGIPVGPMLAKPTKGVSEIVDKFQDMEFTCEYKYDGERAQIHYMENGSVEIYSRNAERNTGKFPDVIAAVSRLKKSSVTSFVLDCELVAYDREKQKILPFQILSTRARKNVVMSDIKVDVCIFAFDILYLDGQPLLQEQLDARREHLYNSFEEEPGFLQFATAITSNDLEEIQKFLEAAVDSRYWSMFLT